MAAQTASWLSRLIVRNACGMADRSGLAQTASNCSHWSNPCNGWQVVRPVIMEFIEIGPPLLGELVTPCHFGRTPPKKESGQKKTPLTMPKSLKSPPLLTPAPPVPLRCSRRLACFPRAQFATGLFPAGRTFRGERETIPGRSGRRAWCETAHQFESPREPTQKGQKGRGVDP